MIPVTFPVTHPDGTRSGFSAPEETLSPSRLLGCSAGPAARAADLGQAAGTGEEMHCIAHLSHVTHVPESTHAPLVRIMLLLAATALVVFIFAATTLVAEAAEVPVVAQTVEAVPQQLPTLEEAGLAAQPGGSDQWPWAIVAVVLVALAGCNYAFARCVALARISSW